jgi:hypothetical protein
MKRILFALAYLGSNWRILALCAVIIILVIILFQDRNRNRFVQVPDTGYVLDTRSGQYCNPWQPGERDQLPMPRCFDLANNWR